MNKKLLAASLCSALIASSITGFAADVENGQPDVYVNNSMIMFNDQPAQIVNDRTLVPARGVFEAMGNKVEWDDKTREVKVTSSTGVTVVTITIDSTEMNVKTYKTIMNAENKTVTLDVPAQIMNDRTMIPLRAVSEAFNCEVEWDEENYCVNITTGEPTRLEGAVVPAPVPEEDKVKMSLSTDLTNISEGDEFDVYVNIENVPDDCVVSATKIVIDYDKTQLSCLSDTMICLDDQGNKIEAAISDVNNNIENGSSLIFVNTYGDVFNSTGNKICKISFKKLTSEPTNMSIDRSYIAGLGYASYVQFTENDAIDYIVDGKDLVIDTTPLVIGK